MANYTINSNVTTLLGIVTGNLNLSFSTTPPTPGAGEDDCTNCPAYITSAVEEPITTALRQIRAIKKRTVLVGEALRGNVANAVAGVQGVVDAIPTPPTFDLSAVIDTLTCPLTPVALVLDPSVLAQFDPRVLWKQIQDRFKEHLRRVTAAYETGLRQLAGFNIVKMGKTYLEDLKRIEFDEVNLARAIAISAYVLGVCPTTHAAGPYAAFDAEITDFDLTDLVPILTLPSDVRDFMLVLMEGETKLAAWRTAATAVPTF